MSTEDIKVYVVKTRFYVAKDHISLHFDNKKLHDIFFDYITKNIRHVNENVRESIHISLNNNSVYIDLLKVSE
ncbi:MAG: hypothetical protein QW575_06285 [Thermoproteota archaeon]